MPRRDDLKRILILGSGPIRIGQAAEFDFSVLRHAELSAQMVMK